MTMGAMADLVNGDHTPKKRKRPDAVRKQPSAKRRAVQPATETSPVSRIERLENSIAESRQNYNNIVSLISMLDHSSPDNATNLPAAVSLCRVFIRLMSLGALSKSQKRNEQEQIVTKWLNKRYEEYQNLLLGLFRQPYAASRNTITTLIMRLVQQECLHNRDPGMDPWKTGLFAKFLNHVLESDDQDNAITNFVDQYVLKYDDVRYYTFFHTAAYLASPRSPGSLETALTLMTRIKPIPSSIESFLDETPKKPKDPILSLTSHKRRAQDAWLGLLRKDISEGQRKKLLGLTSTVIAPWFLKPELFMDFLTDSYNVGGAMSLLALSGLFHLIQEKNLDYPQFYPKLYSLLDNELLHSKHRSRFFRLLNTFLGSTHLPAALVASFIKRISRLALNAPPAGIVAVVPFIYNLLKNHPACTFMIHRAFTDEKSKAILNTEGMDDPFEMSQSDPMLTNAIDSSLWEIETLQSHHHPNVASLAMILSEQFTKQAYNIEDFLDHSYQGMLDAELGKDMKRAPVVEFQIPRRIFTDRGMDEDGGQDDSLPRKLWDFS